MQNTTTPPEKKEPRTIKLRYLFLILPLTIVIVLLVVFAGYFYIYPYYQSKQYLKKAQSFEALADYENSIKFYELYLLQNPQDVEVKLKLTEVLNKNGKHEEAIKILTIIKDAAQKSKNKILLENLYVRLDKTYRNKITQLYKDEQYEKVFELSYALKTELKESENKKLQDAAKDSLIHACNTLSDEYQKKAESSISEKNYSEAREFYKKQLRYIKEKLLLSKLTEKDTNKTELKFDDEVTDDFTLFLQEVSYYSLFNNLANTALTYWLEGDYEKSKEVISAFPSVAYLLADYKVIKRRYRYFASKIEELANPAFDKKKYKEARIHYEGVLYGFENAPSKYSKNQIPRIKYNIALTYANQNIFWKARELFKEIQKEYPDYEKEKIANFIKGTRRAGLYTAGDNQRKKASKCFADKDWTNSREHYREAISYYKKAGEKDSSDAIALCRYNIAITYWNQKNWSKAREKLEEIQDKHPKHMKEEIADMISKIDRFGY